MRILIIGAGLMGGSVGLALNEVGHEICLQDANESILTKARTFLRLENQVMSDPEVVVVAVPPSSVAEVIIEANRSFSNATLIDIASVMLKPLHDADAIGVKIENWIPTHPMAGKEAGGYENASFDLFKDRLWVLSPQKGTEPIHLERAKKVIEDCQAVGLVMDGDVHDQTVAVTSHLPQILATVLASLLNTLDDEALKVSGQGLRDLTRIASSSGELWNEILIANKTNVINVISKMQVALEDMKKAVSEELISSIIDQFISGNTGKLKIPGKHGGTQQEFAKVAIEIDDKPGQLAAIFATAGSADVNIEDVRIDHALGKQVAIIELYVIKTSEAELKTALINAGWKLRAISSAE